MLECGLAPEEGRGDVSSVFVGDASTAMDATGAADKAKTMWIDPFTRTLHWSGHWQHDRMHRCLRLADVAHFRPGGYARSGLTPGERPMSFTLVLRDGQQVPLEMHPGLSDAAQLAWTRALLFYIHERPLLDLQLYNVAGL